MLPACLSNIDFSAESANPPLLEVMLVHATGASCIVPTCRVHFNKMKLPKVSPDQ